MTAEAVSTISRIAKSRPATGCFSGSAPTIPGMAAIIVADSLYSKQPFIEKLTAGRFSFLLVAQTR